MRVFTIKYNYYGHEIVQDIDFVDMIKQLKPAQQVETILEIFENINVKHADQIIEDWQIAVLKRRLKDLKLLMEWVDE